MSLISRNLLKARPQELGRIKIGGLGETRKAQSGREYQLPVKYDHFRVVGRDRGPDGNFVVDEKIHERIGPKPTELDGHLMWEEVEESFHSELMQYDGKTKVVSCDGEERTDLRSGEVRPCPLEAGGECACKPYSRLHLQLWADPLGFYRVFRTTSWESTNNIQTTLEDFHDRFGNLYHLPVKLVVYPATVQYQEGDKTKTGQSYMVGLVLAKSMEEVTKIMVNARRRLTATQSELKRLSGAVQEDLSGRDVEEADVIAQEFFPDGNIQASVKTQEKLDAMKDEMGGVEGEDYEVVSDEDEAEAEAGESEPEEKGDAASTDPHEEDPGSAEASTTVQKDPPEIRALKEELAEAMLEVAPHLLNSKEDRRKWSHRLIGKASPRTATEFELRQLIEAVQHGDTDPEKPAGDSDEEPEATEPSTPFDDDGEQSEMPV